MIPFKYQTYLALGEHTIKKHLHFLSLGRADAACLLISVSSAVVLLVQVPFHGTVIVIVVAVLLELHHFVLCCAFLCLTVICLFVCLLELTSYLATSLLCQDENKHANYCYYCCYTLISLNICAI